MVSMGVAALDSGHSAQHHAHDKGKQDGPDAHVKGNHKAFGDHSGNLTVILQRDTQISVEAVADIDEILLPNGLVQAILGVKSLQDGFGKVFFTREGFARQKLLHEKSQRNQHKQRHHAIGDPLEKILSHAASFLLS